MIHHRLTTTALTVALAMIFTPVALASVTAGPLVRPNPDEQTVSAVPATTGASCGDVCSGHGYGSVGVVTKVPAQEPLCGDVCSGHGYGSVSSPATTVRVIGAGGHRFDWGDAGIGAGVVIVLMLIGTGSVLVVGNRRGDGAHRRRASATS